MCVSPKSDGTGTIKGTVSTNATPDANHEAKGDLYVSVIPAFDMTACASEAPPPVALTIVHCVDLTDGKPFPFEIHGVPPRSEDWQVSAFLDVNGNGIDGCDLLASPSPVALTAAGETGDVGNINLGIKGSVLISFQPQCNYTACM
jgi:hypothetical protein